MFTKFYILKDTNYTNNNSVLREYINTLIYINNGKKLFRHEHFIFCTNFYIRKLTFLFPTGFSQLIVILYLDDDNQKKYPGMFILSNNKKYEGYLKIIKRVRNIITIENSRELKLKSYSTDYEEGLLKAIGEVFIEFRGIGCFFHYCQNIYKNAKKFNINPKKNIIDKEFFSNIYNIPFIVEDNPNIIEYLIKNYKKKIINTKILWNIIKDNGANLYLMTF